MKKISSRSSLLLIELIMAILIFALASGVCLQIFVKSHSLSKRTGELDMAVRQATSVSELLTQKAGAEKVEKTLSRIYPEADLAAGKATIYYDEDFVACGGEDSYFQMEIRSSDSGDGLTSYDIAVYKDQGATKIYNMETTVYQQSHP